MTTDVFAIGGGLFHCARCDDAKVVTEAHFNAEGQCLEPKFSNHEFPDEALADAIDDLLGFIDEHDLGRWFSYHLMCVRQARERMEDAARG